MNFIFSNNLRFKAANYLEVKMTFEDVFFKLGEILIRSNNFEICERENDKIRVANFKGKFAF